MDDSSKQDEQVMTIVATALKLEAQEREPFLRATCGADARLYEEATEAIEWEEKMGGFLRHPMIAMRDAGLPFAPGETISERFEIIRKIGEGGMGIVYEAFDRKRNQRIAIKAAKPGFGRLLSPELEGALRVRHPNVCLVNEIHSTQTAEGDIDFLTMELLEGETLSAALARKGRLPTEEARNIARQLCAGLREAHRSGVIHRDLKAGNVILCRTGADGLRAVITDFGLSGEASQAGFFGTQRYMAPELLLGQKASPASDIYALGVILYEMVAGIKPEESADTVDTAAVPASHSYQRVVADFLSLQRERRVRAFDSALEKLSRRPYSRRQLFGAAMGAVCALGGGGWMERENIENWLQPLPKKRFVALMAWPPDMNLQIKPLVSGAIDAIESELARAEANDRDLFVIPARNAIDPHENGWLGKLGESLGVNLALQASGVETAQQLGLLLKLLDVSTGTVLRQHQIICSRLEIGSLAARAVQAAAGLLNVRWDEQGAGRQRPATDSVAALQAFQAAEEFRKKPNDDGLKDAIEGYKRAIEADPQYANAYARLALAYCQLNFLDPDLGVIELAQRNAAKAIQIDPNWANGHLALAMVLDARGNPDGALAEMHTAARLDPANPKLVQWQALIYRNSHRWQEAERGYRQLQKERPNYWVPYNELGILATGAGRYREAVEYFRTAAAAAPWSALAVNNLGALNFKVGNLAQADASYRKSLAIKPTDLAYRNLGEILRVAGRLEEGLARCKAAVKLDPSNDENWLGLADCHESIGGHQRQAHESFQRAALEAERRVQADSKNGARWIRLALYHMKMADAKNAWSFVKKAEEHGPLDMDSELLKIRVFELAGKRKEALELVASCLKRGPVRFQIESIKDLRGLTKDPRYSQLLRSL